MRRVLLLALAVPLLAACGGGDESSAPAPAAPAETGTATEAETDTTETAGEPEPTATDAMEKPEPDPGLPAALAGYREWPRLNAEPIPPRDSDPHSGTKDVYTSVPAEDGVYPEGAIVVKEATRPGADFVGLVAMMRKEAGANPEHEDWVMVEWTRDAPDAPYAEVASGSVCTSCHMQARDTDYVFTR